MSEIDWKEVAAHLQVRADGLGSYTTSADSPGPHHPKDPTAARVLYYLAEAIKAGLANEDVT